MMLFGTPGDGKGPAVDPTVTPVGRQGSAQALALGLKKVGAMFGFSVEESQVAAVLSGELAGPAWAIIRERPVFALALAIFGAVEKKQGPVTPASETVEAVATVDAPRAGE